MLPKKYDTAHVHLRGVTSVINCRWVLLLGEQEDPHSMPLPSMPSES